MSHDVLDKPVQVQRAVALLWISLALGVIVSLLGVDWSFPAGDAFAWWFLGVMGLTYLLFGVLIFFVSRRHNWARWLVLALTVIGALATFVPWPGFSIDWTLSDLATQIGLLALDSIALIWLFTGAGGAWFAASRVEGP